MSRNIPQRFNARTAKLVGSSYFLLLGLTNLVATFIFAEIRMLDTITLVVCILPFLINRKLFHLLFGIITALIAIYLTIAGLTFMINPAVHTSTISFLMGFLLTGSALLASLLLIFSGSSDGDLKLYALNKV